MPGLFGNYLKKNIIYDLLNNNLVDKKINLLDEYQWFYLNNLKDIFQIISNKEKIILNVATPPISNKELLKLFNNINIETLEESKIKYNMKSLYSSNGYFFSKEQIFNDLKKFIDEYRNI